MFKRLREKIERALERKESQRPISRDDLDRILRGMREELIEMRARIPRLEKEAEDLKRRAEESIRRAEYAHKKAGKAESAGNPDEAARMLEAARRSLSDAESLRNQAAEMRGEADRMKAEAAERMEELKQAERSKSTLLARSRRAGTAQRLEEMLQDPDSGVRRFEKAEEDIETAEDMAAASREVDEALGEGSGMREIEADIELRRLEAAEEADEVEKRLEQLKREMERESD